MLLQVQKGDLAHNEAGSHPVVEGTKDGAASDDVLHEFVNWSDATTLEDIFVRASFVFLPFGSKLRDEVPPRHFEALSMLLDFRRLQTHTFSNDKQHTTAYSSFVDVSDSSVSRTFNRFG